MKISLLKQLIVLENKIMSYENVLENLNRYEVNMPEEKQADPDFENMDDRSFLSSYSGRPMFSNITVACITKDKQGAGNVTLSADLIDPLNLYDSAKANAISIIGHAENDFAHLLSKGADQAYTKESYDKARELITVYYSIKSGLNERYPFQNDPYLLFSIKNKSELTERLSAEREELHKKQMENILAEIEAI